MVSRNGFDRVMRNLFALNAPKEPCQGVVQDVFLFVLVALVVGKGPVYTRSML